MAKKLPPADEPNKPAIGTIKSDIGAKIASAEGLTVDPAAWKRFVDAHGGPEPLYPEYKNNTLHLGADTVKLAYYWGKFMQPQLDAGRKMDDIVWDSYLQADDMTLGGATGGMGKTATTQLGLTWKYGPELVAWHNEQVRLGTGAPRTVGPIDLEGVKADVEAGEKRAAENLKADTESIARRAAQKKYRPQSPGGMKS